MEIAVIDDGINVSYFGLKPLKRDLEVDEDLNIISRSNADQLCNTHGSICAAIILKHFPEAEITSIKVLDSKTRKGTLPQLLKALEWCLETRIPVINLSIGSTQFQDFSSIRRLITALYRQGSIIVAAYNNQNIYTVPASLECVIGVRHNKELKVGKYLVSNEFEFLVEVNVPHYFKNIYSHEIEAPASNSYAAPYITALVCQMLKGGLSAQLCFIWEKLSRKRFSSFSPNFCVMPDIIDEAEVVDLSGNENCGLFYFKVNKIYTIANIDELSLINQLTYIVVIAERESDLLAVRDNLHDIEAYIRGIFYCFKAENTQYCIKIGERAWYETYYLKKFKKSKQVKIDIPLVYLKGTKEALIPILKELEMILTLEDYSVKIVGEFKRAYLYGFEFSKNHKSRLNVINNVYQHFQPDIIICGILENMPSDLITGLPTCCGEEDLYLDLKEFGEGCNHSRLIYQKILEKFDVGNPT
ncbi:MAG: S8 family serine peptidase [Lachnospiraceae bacterium]|nr:S8 family serine peptidase [Lachnospiraceae bacterium]